MLNTEVNSVQVYFDATRLLKRGLTTPTGIDRVDHAYLAALSASPDFRLRLICFDQLGAYFPNRRIVARLVHSVQAIWQYDNVAMAPPGSGDIALLPLLLAFSSRRTGRREALQRIYVNTSHGILGLPSVSRWLRDQKIGGVFFVHDLIPIRHPEFNRPREPSRHADRLQAVATHARRVIVNSETTRTDLLRYLHERELREPPVSVLPLGVRWSGEPAASRPQGSRKPSFVMLGTIEPRKNHQLILQIWRRLIEEMGESSPMLHVVGRRGWENERVFNLLDRTPILRGHVTEHSGLGDADVVSLLKSACALLAPSWVEGYGLPVAEALSLGTPVIASAIDAHHEIGGGVPDYLDPLDGLGWLNAIRDYSAEPSSRRSAQLARITGYRPPRWKPHLQQAMDLIKQAAGTGNK